MALDLTTASPTPVSVLLFTIKFPILTKLLFSQFLSSHCLLNQLYHCTETGLFAQVTFASDLQVAKSKSHVLVFTVLNISTAPDKWAPLPS